MDDMLTVTKQRTSHRFRLLIAVGLLLALPFIGSLQVSAQSMNDHVVRDSGKNCASYCAGLGGSAATPSAIIRETEFEAPDPILYPEVPYYSKLQSIATQKSIAPHSKFSTSPLRPPDIITLTANLRI